MDFQPQLQLIQLACQRGDRMLFSGLDLILRAGNFVQIEGHNGIGKTSLLRILAGLATPFEGEVHWNGVDIRKQREEFNHSLLFLGHQSGVKPELSAWENLRFYQQISPCQQGDEALWDVLTKVGLLGREDLPASQCRRDNSAQLRANRMARC